MFRVSWHLTEMLFALGSARLPRSAAGACGVRTDAVRGFFLVSSVSSLLLKQCAELPTSRISCAADAARQCLTRPALIVLLYVYMPFSSAPSRSRLGCRAVPQRAPGRCLSVVARASCLAAGLPSAQCCGFTACGDCRTVLELTLVMYMYHAV